ncbi:hypothetical protein CupriaWKF_17740 [Cupriavidus sp. WKF15]|uniref:hypothetical protein n=1 Tax=Cupriavidus sp. WKF15 TaxID=3032282 RepID=UPI0023E26E48|nr:hypothetical protein [Cupriavidus sp. WKF15]WER49021.1 hypothetical protein CupriaWKF_17740 [Cupriavidus sp. WKF15]
MITQIRSRNFSQSTSILGRVEAIERVGQRVGLPHEPGRGFCKYLPLHFELPSSHGEALESSWRSALVRPS